MEKFGAKNNCNTEEIQSNLNAVKNILMKTSFDPNVAEDCILKELFNVWKVDSMINLLKDISTNNAIDVKILGKISEGTQERFEVQESCPQSDFVIPYSHGHNIQNPLPSKTVTNSSFVISKDDIKYLLNQHTYGTVILNYYAQHKKIDQYDRYYIVLYIMYYMLFLCGKLTPDILSKIVAAIIDCFPNENIDENIGRSETSGTVCDTCENTMHKSSKNDEVEHKIIAEEPIKIAQNKKLSLTKNIIRLKITRKYSTINCRHLKTKTSRRLKVSNKVGRRRILRRIRRKYYNLIYQKSEQMEILEDWELCYENPSFALDSIDAKFKILYPENECNLWTKWNDFLPKIILIFKEMLKDEILKRTILKIERGNMKRDFRDYIILKFLNGIITPHVTQKREGQSKKIQNQLSLSSIVLHAENNRQMKEIIERIKRILKVDNRKFQPTIITVGTSGYDLGEIYIYVNGKTYRCSSFVSALDICFKIFHVFNIKYTYQSRGLWLFIQKYFYEIDTLCNDMYYDLMEGCDRFCQQLINVLNN